MLQLSMDLVCPPSSHNSLSQRTGKLTSLSTRPSAVDLQIILFRIEALRCGTAEMVEKRAERLSQFSDAKDNVLAHELWKKMKTSQAEVSVVKRIGQGASGDVHQGVFRGNDVAIKTFRDEDKNKSFHEIELLFELRHPHIIGLYAWFVTAVSCELTKEESSVGDRKIEAHLANPAVQDDGIGMLLEFAQHGDLYKWYRSTSYSLLQSLSFAMHISKAVARE